MPISHQKRSLYLCPPLTIKDDIQENKMELSSVINILAYREQHIVRKAHCIKKKSSFIGAICTLLKWYLLVCHRKPSAFSSLCDELGNSHCVVVLRMSLLSYPNYCNPKWSLGFSSSVMGRETCACLCMQAQTWMHLASPSKCISLKMENFFYKSLFEDIFVLDGIHLVSST